MGDCVEITIWPKHPRTIYPVTSSAFVFEVKTESSLNITLATDSELKSKCWIELGHIQSSVGNGGHPAMFETRNILSGYEFRKFWLTWFDGRIRLGRDRETHPLLEYAHQLSKVQYISFGGKEPFNYINLKFDLSPLRPTEKTVYFDEGKPQWRTAIDQLPLGAVIGGIDNEPLYVIRAEHNGSLTPGKFVPSEGLGYLPWGGDANAKEDFEVLCGYNFKWVKSSNGMIPSEAIPAGHAEHTHEPLYVGRAEHEGHIIPGKVQATHRVCYIPYDGKEVAKSHYEILVHVEKSRRMRYILPAEENLAQFLMNYNYDSDDLDNERAVIIINR